MNANDFFQAGNLQGAIKAALEEVKKNPADAGKRDALDELQRRRALAAGGARHR